MYLIPNKRDLRTQYIISYFPVIGGSGQKYRHITNTKTKQNNGTQEMFEDTKSVIKCHKI